LILTSFTEKPGSFTEKDAQASQKAQYEKLTGVSCVTFTLLKTATQKLKMSGFCIKQQLSK